MRRRGASKRGTNALGWHASSSDGDQLQAEFRFPRWPPFFATAIYLPRLNVRLTNRGRELGPTTLSLMARPYEDPIGEIGQVKEGWWGFGGHSLPEGWPTGATVRWRPRLPANSLPKAGTYAVRIEVRETRQSPGGTLREETEKFWASVPLDESTRQHLMGLMAPDQAVDWEAPVTIQSLGFHADYTPVEYFRVEALSSVLTFQLVIWTAVMALGTLILAVAALVS